MTVYEIQAEAGGRIRSISVPEHHLNSIELGSRVFSNTDVLLNGLIDELGFRQDVLSSDGPKRSVIFDGSKTVGAMLTASSSWIDWAKQLRVYGTSLLSTVRTSRSTSTKVHRISEKFPVRDVYRVTEDLSISSAHWWTPFHFLRSRGIAGRFVQEYVGALLHAFFGQSVLETNAFQLAVAFNSQLERGLHLKGGNCRLIEEMLNRNAVQTQFSTFVSQITTASNGSIIVNSVSTKPDNQGATAQMAFDSVVLASPWTEIQMPDLPFPLGFVPYTSLTVTHFLSFLDFDPDILNLRSEDSQPNDLLFLPPQHTESVGKENPSTKRIFRIIREDLPPSEDKMPRPYLYRVLSSRHVSDADLLPLLRKPCRSSSGAKDGQSTSDGHDTIIWRHNQHWPYAYPTAGYESLDYSTSLADNIFTTAPGELLGSTMETAVAMGANAARLVDESMRRQMQYARFEGPVYDEFELDE